MTLVQVVESSLQSAFDFLYGQWLTDHPGGKWQYSLRGNTRQLRQSGARALGIDQALGAGACVGIAGIGQQVAHGTLQALTGDDHRRRAERIGGGHTRHTGAFGAAHHHYIFAPWALDASRGNAQFKTGNRMQGRQRTKTNSHTVNSLSNMGPATAQRAKDAWCASLLPKRSCGTTQRKINGKTPRAAKPVAAQNTA